MLIVSPPYQGRVQNQYGTLSGNVTGNSTISGTNIVYVGGSNVTLQGAGDSVYIHGASGGGGSGSGVAISASTASQANGVVVFSASNGVSFGLNAGTLTGSVQTNYLTGTRSQSLNEIQNPAADAVIFMNTRQLQLQWGSNFTTFTTNANRQGLFEIDIAGNFTDSAADLDGVHIHQSTFDPPMHLLHLEADGTNPVPLHITCAGATAALINRPIYYNGGSVPMVLGTSQSNSVQYLNANYVQGKASSDFQSTGAYLTTAQPPGAYLTTAAQVSHSHGNPTLALTNIAGSTASASSGLTLSLSYPASSNFFATSNNTFANSTHTHGSGPSITGPISVTSSSGAWSISVSNYITTQTVQPMYYSASGTSSSSGSIQFSNTNGVTFSLTNGAICASVGTAYAASTHTHGSAPSITGPVSVTSNSGAWSINVGAAGVGTSATNASITLNTNGLAISVNAPGGGAAPNLQYFEVADIQGFGLATHISAIDKRPIFVPFILPGNLTNNSAIIQMSGVTQNSILMTVQAALYTYANATSMNLLDSLQNAFSGTSTALCSGNLYFALTGWGTNATALTPGPYVLGLNFSANGGNTASANFSIYGGVVASTAKGFWRPGTDNVNTANTTSGPMNLWGRYTATSASPPAAVGQANIYAGYTGASQPIAPWFVLRS